MTAIEDARALRAALGDNANYGDAGQFYPGLERVEEVLDALIAEHERLVEDLRISDEIAVGLERKRQEAVAQVERLTAPPTDDEHEALSAKLADEVEYRIRTAVALSKGGHGIGAWVSEGREAVMRIASKFRRQGPITDAQVEAGFRAALRSGAGQLFKADVRAALEAAEDAR